MTREKNHKPPTKTAIARNLGERINAHLKRIEADPKLNPSKHYDKKLKRWVLDPGGVRDYYNANAIGQRHRVWVLYVSYQGGSYLSIEEAEAYLAWLDAGHIGTHYMQQHQAKATKTA